MTIRDFASFSLASITSLAFAGCIPARSAELACSVNADCSDGRTCEGGFCVAEPTVDAPPLFDDGGQPDGSGPDADAFDCTKLTSRHFTGCDIPRPTRELSLEAAGTFTYNTDQGILLSPTSEVTIIENANLADARLISIEKLTIAAGAKLRVIGAKPLIIASWSTITVAGTIDVSSTATELGAGANPAGCAAHAAIVGQNEDAAGGGGGGGFGGKGGKGGNGNGSTGGAGGAAVSAPLTAPLLLGGCAGARGGNENNNPAGGPGGNGGGALQLTALDSITITGTITAAGAGGGAAIATNGGGGGGGAGGMIGLEANTISINTGAAVAANGGAGGGGADSDNLNGITPGQPGTNTVTPALGGNGNGGGADGGNGGAGATVAGADGKATNDDGGGGAGGGVGFVILSSTLPATATGVVSPAATLVAR